MYSLCLTSAEIWNAQIFFLLYSIWYWIELTHWSPSPVVHPIIFLYVRPVASYPLQEFPKAQAWDRYYL